MKAPDVYARAQLDPDRRPVVVLGADGREVQLTVEQARRLALQLLQAAEAAQQEQALWLELTSKDLSPVNAGLVLVSLRQRRRKMRKGDNS